VAQLLKMKSSDTYLRKLEAVTKLLHTMDLPQHRKSVRHNDDVRWLKNNLEVRNAKHKHFQEAMELLKSI
jgi:hypothetical protein